MTSTPKLPTEVFVDAFFMHLISHGVPSIMTRFLAFRDCYSGYFADPDGHLWEIAYNPFLEMDAAGNAVGMKAG